MPTPLLETQQLTKDYGTCRALDGLTLSIDRGEIVGLLGPNGSGKSTAIRLLLGFLQPTAGWARVDGYDCWRESVAVRRRIAYLPGELRLYENLTGRRFLQFLAGLRGQSFDAGMLRLAAQFDIDLDRPLRTLSSGMKRKVALMQVLLPNVPLAILDEPTNTLDPTMRDELLDQIAAAKVRGEAVLFSSHVLQEVERICDRVAILSRGRLVHLQRMADLRSNRRVVVHFAAPPTHAPPGDIRVHAQSGLHWTLASHGEIGPLLNWLGTQPVADLRIEPEGLSAIYQQFHKAADTVLV